MNEHIQLRVAKMISMNEILFYLFYDNFDKIEPMLTL